MRKLVLCNFKAKTGDYEFEDYRLVVTNHNEGETETELSVKATKAFMNDFPNYFPESKLLSAVALPTMGANPEPTERNESALHFTNFHDMDDHPEVGDEGYSDDVLIDLDGWRKDFRIGYYDKDNGWQVYQHAHDGEETKLDLKHGKWTHLPINKENIKDSQSGD